MAPLQPPRHSIQHKDYAKQIQQLQKVVAEKNAQINVLQDQINELNTFEDEIENEAEPSGGKLYNKVRLKILYALVDKVGWHEEKHGAKIALARLAQEITGIGLKQCQDYIPERETDTTYHDQQLNEIRKHINAAEIDISI